MLASIVISVLMLHRALHKAFFWLVYVQTCMYAEAIFTADNADYSFLTGGSKKQVVTAVRDKEG